MAASRRVRGLIRVLFDGFCDADDPALRLGKSLRTQEEATLLKVLGEAYSVVQDHVGRMAPHQDYLDCPEWALVIKIAAKPAQVMVMVMVMVTNDLQATALLHDEQSQQA
ncbi:hypothetical protein ACFYXS_05590 [Streptomyces sp. NPDC002574]|uniref:SCO4402 family protein n=1 Tax=Streptomyces sp. NPDC002574 TaxID=3364652 RepID=UPI0036B80437